jgi:hypothetical protein
MDRFAPEPGECVLPDRSNEINLAKGICFDALTINTKPIRFEIDFKEIINEIDKRKTDFLWSGSTWHDLMRCLMQMETEQND